MYILVFIILVIGAVAVQYRTRQVSTLQTSTVFQAFQRNYLLVYLIVMFADWLQGPYVYALYESYDYGMEDIASLFIAGFFSSMVFGTFVGSLGDKYGRKLMCLIFGITYSFSCITKLFNYFWILMIGRILSGIATSLLFSSFESWMVHQHKHMSFPEEWLDQTFSIATFGNGIVAIVAGLVASGVADYYGYVAPFMTALVILILSTGIVAQSWTENFGDSQSDLKNTFIKAYHAMFADKNIVLVGGVQSFFEGAMYTFVFMWTPALQAADTEHLPFGLIFASFMLSIMIGSSIFSLLIKHMCAERLMQYNLLIAAVSLAIGGMTSNKYLLFLMFLVFEISCGIYFPCQGSLRGHYIPNEFRSAIMNYFRVPLNFIVVLVLVKASSLTISTIFWLCAFFLILGALCQTMLLKFVGMPPMPNLDLYEKLPQSELPNEEIDLESSVDVQPDPET